MIGVNVKGPALFKDSKPPPGYVAGVGRGAVGFVTRSDIGSAASVPGAVPAAGRGLPMAGGRGVMAALGMSAAKAAATGGSVPGEKSEDFSEANYDKFAGYSERLFSDTPYDADDAEADKIYRAVDEAIDNRHKRRRMLKEAEEQRSQRLQQSRIADTFAADKQELAKVSAEEWEAIPDIGDRSLRYKKKPDNFVPVPDSIIAMNKQAITNTIDPTAAYNATPAPGGLTDIRGLSEARGQMLTLKLDKMSDNVSGQTVVDPKGYLTSLTSQSNAGIGNLGAETDVADVKKARLLLKSVIMSNPRHGPGWIAAARLEEQVNNLSEARKLIRQGCENCPEDEDVWLESARMQHGAHARLVLADAVRHVPHSVKIWIAASELETDINAKKAVLRKALTLIPASEKLWKAAISLEPEEDAKIMLARAVECVPKSVDLWLALARLETYENAQKVLNQARQAIPTDATIWIAAAKLEESQGNTDNVQKIITRALKSLTSQQVVIDREAWIKHAEDAEKTGLPITASVIIKVTADVGVDEIDRRRTWLADAEALEEHGSIHCARAMHEKLLAAFPDKEVLWIRAAKMEKQHGDREHLMSLLATAVGKCPHAEVLWLMWAKEAWLGGDVAAARNTLGQAFAANPASEQIWLAAVKLEWENEELERARTLLERARVNSPTPRVWMKSAMLERETNNNAAQEKLLLEGIAKYPAAPKLYMMLAQLYEGSGHPERAKEVLHAGLKANPICVTLWLLAAKLEEKLSGPTKARTLLETARFRNAKNAELWLEAVQLERRAGNEKLAESLMAKALQECPTSGRLWADVILHAPRAAQKRKCSDALQKCENDAFVVLAIARLFWADRKYDKARNFFNRAVSLDADLGDAWIAYYAFELQHGTREAQEDVLKRCVAADPAHGNEWQAVAKRPENRRLSKAEVLKLAVKEMREREAASGLFEQKSAAPVAVAVADNGAGGMQLDNGGDTAAAEQHTTTAANT